MFGAMLGGVADGQQKRQDMELRRNADARAQEEFGQMKRMREYELNDRRRQEDLDAELGRVKEFHDSPLDAGPDYQPVRRSARDIALDRANIMARFGGAKNLTLASQLRSDAYKQDREEIEAGLGAIRAMPIGDAEKAQRAAEFLSQHRGVPGKIQVLPTEAGLAVQAYGADGALKGTGEIRSFDDLYRNTMGSLTYDNYLKAHEIARADRAEGRVERLFPYQLRGAAAGANKAESDARVTNATEQYRIQAGKYIPLQAEADVAAKRASAAKDSSDASLGPYRAQLIGQQARYYGGLADGDITKGGRGGSSAGPRNPGTITVNEVGPEGKTVKKQLSVARDQNGTVTFIDPTTNKPYTNDRNIEAALDREDELLAVQQRMERDLGSVRQRFERGDASNPDALAEFEAARRQIERAALMERQRVEFRHLTPQERIEQIKKGFAQKADPETFVSFGATPQEINAGRQAWRADLDATTQAQRQAIANERAPAWRAQQEREQRLDRLRGYPNGPSDGTAIPTR